MRTFRHRSASAARRIEQNAVKREQVIQLTRIHIHHGHARRTLSCDVVAQAVGAHFIAFAGGDHCASAGQRRANDLVVIVPGV